MKIYDTEVKSIGKYETLVFGERFCKNVYVLPDKHTYVIKHYKDYIPVYRMTDYFTNNLQSYIRRTSLYKG